MMLRIREPKACLSLYLSVYDVIYRFSQAKSGAPHLSVMLTAFTRLNAAAFIKFLAFPVRRLFKGGVYSKATFISKSYFLNH